MFSLKKSQFQNLIKDKLISFFAGCEKQFEMFNMHFSKTKHRCPSSTIVQFFGGQLNKNTLVIKG